MNSQEREKLNGRKIAILAMDGFEQSELFEPLEAMKAQGAICHIISLKSGEIKAWHEGNWGKTISVDRTLDEADANDYNALFIPGGVINPDKLRNEESALRFTKAFFGQKKPVASICHGPQVLISAKVVEGRKMTSYPSIRIDLENAGANFKDQEVVVDDGLVTSRSPEDLPAFIDKLIEEVAEGKHEEQHA